MLKEAFHDSLGRIQSPLESKVPCETSSIKALRLLWKLTDLSNFRIELGLLENQTYICLIYFAPPTLTMVSGT